MRLRHFRLVIVPKSPTDEISQIKCPYCFIHLFIAFILIIVAVVAGFTYHLARHYYDMRQETVNLPDLRRQVLRQQALIEQSEETMREIRTYIAQLQRAQARLPLSSSPLREFILPSGMGGEVYIDAQNEEQSISELENDMDRYFSILQKSIQQQQHMTQNLEEYFDEQAQQIASIPHLWPVPGSTRITSKFGMRIHPVTGQRMMHWGIDIGAAKGTTIVSTADGMVIFSGIRGAFGKVIVVDHGSGYTTFYGHCSSLETQRGDRVKRGDTIARVGSSGRTTSNHLHYEVRVDGAAQNPLDFIAE